MTEKVHPTRRQRSPRHLARIFVLLGLYQWLADKTLTALQIEEHLGGLIHDEGEQLEGCDILPSDFEHCDRELFRELLTGILAQADVVEGTFAPFVDRDLKRVSLVEHAVLYVGSFELLRCPQTPWRVVLNESIELAKEFGSGYRFTNAVLERVAREVRKDEVGAETPAS